MSESVVYWTVVAFLFVIFVASTVLAVRGNKAARYFLWVWAVAMIVALPLSRHANLIAGLPAALMLLFFLYVLILGRLRTNEQLEVSHEETRRVLAESNRRIEEERRQISRTLHDLVNPNLALCKSELIRLESKLANNPEAVKSLEIVAELVSDAYRQVRDIIRNTRVELIDSIGFTAAVESLVNHYANVLDKPSIVLEHNLPKRPEIDEEKAGAAYRIIREAIFNSVKHANAKTVKVEMRWSDRSKTVRVVIVDDGEGIRSTRNETGIGLIDMRERARAIGSEVKIGVGAGKNPRPGTKITFSFQAQSLSVRNE